MTLPECLCQQGDVNRLSQEAVHSRRHDDCVDLALHKGFQRTDQAVQSALHKVNTMLLDAHLHSCVNEAVSGEDPTERERMLREVTSVFTMSSKL